MSFSINYLHVIMFLINIKIVNSLRLLYVEGNRLLIACILWILFWHRWISGFLLVVFCADMYWNYIALYCIVELLEVYLCMGCVVELTNFVLHDVVVVVLGMCSIETSDRGQDVLE